MGPKSRFAVGLAMAGSAIVVVTSLVVVFNLLRDINTLYDEVLADIGEFKLFADDAWKTMMDVNRPEMRDYNAFQSILRSKRQYESAVTGGTTTQAKCELCRSEKEAPEVVVDMEEPVVEAVVEPLEAELLVVVEAEPLLVVELEQEAKAVDTEVKQLAEPVEPLEAELLLEVEVEEPEEQEEAKEDTVVKLLEAELPVVELLEAPEEAKEDTAVKVELLEAPEEAKEDMAVKVELLLAVVVEPEEEALVTAMSTQLPFQLPVEVVAAPLVVVAAELALAALAAVVAVELVAMPVVAPEVTVSPAFVKWILMYSMFYCNESI
ncbi:hypothetical protein QR680_010951 [Steinernema hermaphroditum]|uniref:Nematode cuticle collagen N-terminal domain-containing protein n=1 Tax=Steinernema hermaphroditum TaxID=289476 RepID=A0AA39IQL8_9BILA|nr:hypothetical protein QR680_010951 [Steinernema hermaphroditum]